jgi:hypothetical protein
MLPIKTASVFLLHSKTRTTELDKDNARAMHTKLQIMPPRAKESHQTPPPRRFDAFGYFSPSASYNRSSRLSHESPNMSATPAKPGLVPRTICAG